MTDITAKTPAFLLHEYLSRRGITPIYQLIQTQRPFCYYVYFYYNGKKFDAMGIVGGSKKDAKQLAAIALIDKLKSEAFAFDINDNYSTSTTVKSTGITNTGTLRKDQYSVHNNHEENVMGDANPNEDTNIENSGIIKSKGDTQSIKTQSQFSILNQEEIDTGNPSGNFRIVVTIGDTNTGTIRKVQYIKHHNYKEKIIVNPHENFGNITLNDNTKSSVAPRRSEHSVHNYEEKVMDNSIDALRKDGSDIHKYKEKIESNLSGFYKNMTINGDNYTGSFRSGGCDVQKFEENNFNKLLDNLGILKSNGDTCTDAFRNGGCNVPKYERIVKDWKSSENPWNVKSNSDAKTIEPRKDQYSILNHEKITTDIPSDNFRNMTSRDDSNTGTLRNDEYSIYYYEEKAKGHLSSAPRRDGYDIHKYKEKITGNPSGDFGNIASNGESYTNAFQKGTYNVRKSKENCMDNLSGGNPENVKLNNDAKNTTFRKDDYSLYIDEENVMENPIGSLQELCMTRHWPLPIYEIEMEIIPAGERRFAISCTILDNTEVGVGKNKKLAKRLAAQKMLTKLRFSNFHLSDEEDDTQDVEFNKTFLISE